MIVASNVSADLIIIGGGIHGCATAMFAAQRGMDVIVIEKDTVGRHASGVNAGGVRRLGRDFREIPISQHSMKLWYQLPELVEDDCGFQIAPQIRVAETTAEMESLYDRVAQLQTMGFDHEVVLSQSELRRRLPAVSDHVVGGIGSLRDGFAQPYQTTFAISRRARRDGARIFEGQAVKQVVQRGELWEVVTEQTTFSAPKVLNCAGAWAGRIAESLGEMAPVKAVAPMMLVTSRLPQFCDSVIGAAGRPLSFKQMPNGTVVIGGGRLGHADTSNNLSETVFSELRQTAATAVDIFPIMRKATVVRSWSGIEGRMPDGIPVIGPSKRHQGIFYAFGFSLHGFQMGLGVGDIMAELISNGATQWPLDDFSIGRFVKPVGSN
ncbi:MAG: NAD(P)/FAD-dependent oxidoreductase [Granulosicoccus sp.]